MGADCRRRGIDDRSWDPIKGLLPGQRDRWGGAAEDNRRVHGRRVGQRPCDGHLYKLRHPAGNAFERIERRRGPATRHCKRASSLEAAVQISCLTL